MITLIAFLLLFSSSGEFIKVTEQWMRPGAKGGATALYFTINNNGTEADTLNAVTSSISDKIQIHETYKNGDMMGMREIGKIVVEPHSKVKLKPGGMHVMIMKLKRDVVNGEKIDFILHFKKEGDLHLTAEVKKY